MEQNAGGTQKLEGFKKLNKRNFVDVAIHYGGLIFSIEALFKEKNESVKRKVTTEGDGTIIIFILFVEISGEFDLFDKF